MCLVCRIRKGYLSYRRKAWLPVIVAPHGGPRTRQIVHVVGSQSIMWRHYCSHGSCEITSVFLQSHTMLATSARIHYSLSPAIDEKPCGKYSIYSASHVECGRIKRRLLA